MNSSDVYDMGDIRITKITEQIFRTLTVGQLYPDSTPSFCRESNFIQPPVIALDI